jgi:hypothetical protein
MRQPLSRHEGFGRVAPGEVFGAEVLVVSAVTQHVVAGGLVAFRVFTYWALLAQLVARPKKRP